MLIGLQKQHVVYLADGRKVFPAHLYGFKRIFVAGTIVEIEPSIVVEEQTRVP